MLHTFVFRYVCYVSRTLSLTFMPFVQNSRLIANPRGVETRKPCYRKETARCEVAYKKYRVTFRKAAAEAENLY